MIVTVDQSNLEEAATIHSVSWQDSHRLFCSPEFIALHTPQHQKEYLQQKMDQGSRLFMLIEDKPVGIVSVTGSLIEDLYILPDYQHHGYGTCLLRYAIGQCDGIPALWILENNKGAEKLYRREGFRETGRKNVITDRLDEIEFSFAGIRTDFSTITACGECCTACPKKQDGRCPGCIEADGHVPEWAESGGCRIHACTRKHHAQFCGLCTEFPCKKLPELISWNPDIVRKMSSLRDEYFLRNPDSTNGCCEKQAFCGRKYRNRSSAGN